VVDVGLYAGESLFARASIARSRAAPARRAAPGLPRDTAGCWAEAIEAADRRWRLRIADGVPGQYALQARVYGRDGSTAGVRPSKFEGSYRVSAPHTGARFASGAEHCGRSRVGALPVETLVRPRGLT